MCDGCNGWFAKFKWFASSRWSSVERLDQRGEGGSRGFAGVGIGHDDGAEVPDFLDFVLAAIRDCPVLAWSETRKIRSRK